MAQQPGTVEPVSVVITSDSPVLLLDGESQDTSNPSSSSHPSFSPAASGKTGNHSLRRGRENKKLGVHFEKKNEKKGGFG